MENLIPTEAGAVRLAIEVAPPKKPSQPSKRRRAAQKAATAAVQTTATTASSTAALIEQPGNASRSQQPATDDVSQPLEAGAIIVEPVSPIARHEPLPKVGKQQTRSKRARRRTENASESGASAPAPSSITTALLGTVSPGSAACEIGGGTHPSMVDAMAKMPARDVVPPKESIKLGQKALSHPQREKMKANAALNNAPSSVVEPTAALQTATLGNAPIGTPPIDATASKPPPARTLASRTAWMLRDTGTLVRTITATSIEPDSIEVSSKFGFETLCSYNWQMDGTIFVPGGPPKWIPPRLPVTLPPDTGRHFMDQNTHRVPKYPFEPAFQALSIMNPNMSLDTVDIVANRNSFRKLLDFAAGRKRDPWCMGLHMVNNTLFISRKERNAIQMIHGSARSGYGHNFEKAFTKPEVDMENSSSHHRVIRYHIGPLHCVVRFEVDAYYEDPNAVPEPAQDVSTAMAQLQIRNLTPSQPSRQPKTAGEKTTLVIRKGSFINPSKLAEIKAKRFDRINEALPQLWFGRTPWFMNGNHNKGRFHSVTTAHAKDLYSQWEENNQDRLRKMVSLLVELKDAVQGLEGRAAILIHGEKGGDLKVYQTERDGGVLSKEVIRRHWTVDEIEAR